MTFMTSETFPEHDEVDHILSAIQQTTIKYIRESESNFIGLTNTQIEDLEKTYQLSFPKAYRQFLQRFAAGPLKVYDYQTYGGKGIAEAQEVSKGILSLDGTPMPEQYFAFSQWQGYQFYYFINSGKDNPDTFLYLEGGADPAIDPPEIYAYGSFTDWLLQLTISNMTLIGELRGLNVTEGVDILKRLLSKSD